MELETASPEVKHYQRLKLAAALARILGPFLGPALFFVPPRYLLPYLIGAVLLLGVLLLSLRVRPEQ